MLNHIKWHDLAVLLYYPTLCNETLYNGTRTNLLFGDVHTVAVLLPWHFFLFFCVVIIVIGVVCGFDVKFFVRQDNLHHGAPWKFLILPCTFQ